MVRGYHLRTFLSIFLLFCTIGYADNPPETIYDEGVRKGTAFNINCVGSGVTCTQSGITGTITVNGGSSSLWALSPGNVGIFTGYPVAQNVGIGTITPTDYLTVQSGVSGGETINAVPVGIGGIDGSTNLMLHLNNNVTDSSSNGYSTSNTGVTFSNASPNFTSTYYGVFNGSSYLNPSSSSMVSGSGNQTHDFWIYPTSVASTAPLYFDYTGSTDFNGFLIGYPSSGYITAYKYVGGIQQFLNSSASAVVSANSWQHMAIVRNGNTWNWYVNGTSQLSWTDSSSYPSYSTSEIGGAYSHCTAFGTCFPGNIQEYRISNSARWTSNFTPPPSPYTVSSVTPTLSLNSNGSNLSQIKASSSTQALSIINNGITAVTINSTGNIGIGSITPGQALDVNGNIRTTGTNKVILGNDNANYIANSASTSGATTFSTNSLERMRIGNDGNIGIGTTITAGGGLSIMNGNVGIGTWVPSQSLSIGNNQFTVTSAGAVSAGTGQFTIPLGGGATAVTFSTNVVNGANAIQVNSYGTQTNVSLGAGYNTEGYVGTTNNYPFSLRSNGTDRMMFDTNGNVGIGTTTPVGGLIMMNGNVGIGTWIPTQPFQVNKNALPFVIDANSNVGIGTTLPTQALDVVGTVRGLSAGACTFLYKCVGGVDAGVIQTSACNLCPGGSCTQMNGCF